MGDHKHKLFHDELIEGCSLPPNNCARKPGMGTHHQDMKAY